MRRSSVLAAVVSLLAVAVPATADAHVIRLTPSHVTATGVTFSLTKVKRARGTLVSARLVARKSSRAISVVRVRNAIRKGRLHVSSKAKRRSRLVLVMDRAAPTEPTGLSASTGSSGVTLGWQASRDDVGVKSYAITRDGTSLGSVPATTRTYVDTAAPAGAHSYTVRAVDRAGRRSDAATAVAAAPTISPQTTSVSGEPAPSGDLPGWTLIFRDDFTQNVPVGRFPDAVSSTWGAYDDGGADTHRNGITAPRSTVSLHDGLLDIHLHTDGAGNHLGASPYPKLPGTFGQVYGRYAVRFRADPIPGYSTAWLLWPDSENWPQDGEIDFPEGDLSSGICAFNHHLGATNPADQDAFCGLGSYNAWHTAVIEWTAGSVRFLLDGQVVAASTTRVTNRSLHWVLQTETSASEPSDSADGHVLIDWVAVWRPAG